MKKLIALSLLVAFLGTVYADVAPERRLPRPLVNLAQVSVYQPWLGPWAVPMLRLFAPQWVVIAAPQGRAPVPLGDIPVPPVCDLACRMRPIQGIAQ